MDDISTIVERAMQEPKRVKTDTLEVEARPLRDLVEADQYLAACRASRRKHGGLRFVRLILSGA